MSRRRVGGAIAIVIQSHDPLAQGRDRIGIDHVAPDGRHLVNVSGIHPTMEDALRRVPRGYSRSVIDAKVVEHVAVDDSGVLQRGVVEEIEARARNAIGIVTMRTIGCQVGAHLALERSSGIIDGYAPRIVLWGGYVVRKHSSLSPRGELIPQLASPRDARFLIELPGVEAQKDSGS